VGESIVPGGITRSKTRKSEDRRKRRLAGMSGLDRRRFLFDSFTGLVSLASLRSSTIERISRDRSAKFSVRIDIARCSQRSDF